MRRTVGALGLGVLALIGAPSAARAESLFSLSGKVGLADGAIPAGTNVKFQVDLDRNGKFESFETLAASVAADGSYKLKYELSPTSVDFQFIKAATEIIATYKKDGFDGLLKGGPLRVMLSFERQGYTTVVKRLASMSDIVDLDAVLAPLSAVHCAIPDGTDDPGAETTCLSAGGDVRLEGFPGGTGIAKAFARAYDPKADTTQFPGSFSDDQNNLLVSSGFAEINLYDAAGNPIHEVSTPVAVRFEAKREQWATMPDLVPNSGLIELPMYSFDPNKADWTREGDGELQLADGTPVPESELGAIRAGTFAQPVFVAFETLHFSSFNCDAPIKERACVRGRVVDDKTGEALIGVTVDVVGVNYVGSAGVMLTGQDGRFATDVMKSENPGEDSDQNGTAGQTFSAQLSVYSPAGIFLGAAFDNPLNVGSALLNKCRPSECDCLDLGDVPVVFETPRLCQVTVNAVSSGKNVLSLGSAGPIPQGGAVVGANVRGAMTGSVTLPRDAVAAACEGQVCHAGVAAADGSVTFSVPVAGDDAQLQLNADITIQNGTDIHMYSGVAFSASCARDQTTLSAPVTVQLDHANATEFSSFIGSLGEGALVDDDDGLFGLKEVGCGCRVPGTKADSKLAWLGGLLALGLVARRRRRAAKQQ